MVVTHDVLALGLAGDEPGLYSTRCLSLSTAFFECSSARQLDTIYARELRQLEIPSWFLLTG